jgi:hypothetical protein
MGSVQRGGAVLAGPAIKHLNPDETRYLLQLHPHAFNKNDVGARVQKTLVAYVRTYLRENGLKAKSVRLKKGYLEVCISRSRA